MIHNPALRALLPLIQPELVWAQVLVRCVEKGFELVHVGDRDKVAAALRVLNLDELWTLAQFTGVGAFRPLKSSPNLQSGWRFIAADEGVLDNALNVLYPGSVADWFAAQSPQPPITHYREFTNRQTGMYRIAQMLTDEQAAAVIRAGCHASSCLKRRLWTAPGQSPAPATDKCLIPCLEPCAVLLEFARKAMRIEQDEKPALALAEDEVETLCRALEQALAHPDPAVREGDAAHPGNPRRVRLLLEKLELLRKRVSSGNEEQL